MVDLLLLVLWASLVGWVIVLVGIVLSIRWIGMDESGVKRSGDRHETKNSGICFVPRLFSYWGIKKYPKGITQISFSVINIWSKVAQYKGRKCGNQVLRTCPELSLRWPVPGERAADGEECLIKIAKNNVPLGFLELRHFLGGAVKDATERACATLSWREMIENPSKVQEIAQGFLERPESALIQVGFQPEHFKVSISLEISQELKTLLMSIDQNQLSADAAAEISAGAVVKMLSLLWGTSQKETQKILAKDDEKELLNEALTLLRVAVAKEKGDKSQK